MPSNNVQSKLQNHEGEKQFQQKEFYAEVTALILGKLQEGVIEWRKTWKGTKWSKQLLTNQKADLAICLYINYTNFLCKRLLEKKNLKKESINCLSE